MTTPSSTYRMQLHLGTTFADVTERLDYLSALGVSHLYLSPVMQAAPGSTHGYDVVDPGALDEELGGEQGFAELCARARELGIGIVLDIVPNHVAVSSPANRWWFSVLRHGPASPYAPHFDIRWHRRDDRPEQVLLPVLAEPLEEVLVTHGQLRVTRSSGDPEADTDPCAAYRVIYHDHELPVRPGSIQAMGLDPSDVSATLEAFSTDPGRRFSLLLDQHYQLVHWRRANTDLNYRRFFDINALGGLRTEDRAVFDDVHARVRPLIDEGLVDGVRVDHPDGLADPTGYLERLRRTVGPAWIVTEKILVDDERLPRDWPVDGTVGYEFSRLVGGLFVHRRGRQALGDLHDRLVGRATDYEEVVETARRMVIEHLFPAEFSQLLDLLRDVAEEAGVVVDDVELHETLREILTAYPVYRTYVRPDQGTIAPADREIIEATAARVRARLPELSDAIDLVREVLLLEQGGRHTAEFVVRLQQLTGPVMAKGVEDTAFYRHVPFVAANEVGGSPHDPETTLASFHAANRLRQRDAPASMLTTSTHDTKRSEDVRARLSVLTQIPDLWARTVEEWCELARPHHGRHGPSPEHELLTYQSLVGAWPIDADRIAAYLVKAAREGKERTGWLAPDELYEADLTSFARGLVGDTTFRASLERFLAEILEPGRLTALSQTLLKLTSPGVPDVYQGSEVWNLSLVDPDNRRPVDFGVRHRMLADLGDKPHPVEVLAGIEHGLPKLWVTRQALRLRRQLPRPFGREGTYEPVHAEGERQDHVVAFLRGTEVLTIAPRLVTALGRRFASWDWGDTGLPVPAGRWRCVLSEHVVEADGGVIPLHDLLDVFPTGLFVRQRREP